MGVFFTFCEKMKSGFILVLSLGLLYCSGVRGENENNIKNGTFPYMAFIYYSDPSVVDAAESRFMRSAVLIRSNWLVTSAIGPSVINTPNGFPMKTLLARVGAVAIDANVTLNEDEDEQEREIIQIIRPYNHSATQWWTTDISLMKTLLPFNMTSTVGVKALNMKREFGEKNCFILVYARKYGNTTEDKVLMQLFVEMLPPSIDNCGSHFSAGTMACASDSEVSKDNTYDVDFCQGNSGGPLICENEVMGLQTYIGGNCKQPHLYQLLATWDTFISCGVEDKCQEDQCVNVCDVTNKDLQKIVEPEETLPQVTFEFVSAPTPTEKLKDVQVPTSTSKIIYEPQPITGTTITVDTDNNTFIETTDVTTALTNTTNENIPTTQPTETSPTTNVTINFWPKEKETNDVENDLTTPIEYSTERLAKLEAHRLDADAASGSASLGNLCLIQNLFFQFLALLCLI